MFLRLHQFLMIGMMLFLMSISAKAQVKFYAQTDARQVVAGQFFKVSFVLENARGQGFKAPDFNGFEVSGGPATSTQMSIVNGRSSQKMSYTYSLTGDKLGKIKIGSATIIAGGKTYTSAPVIVEVVKGRKREASKDGTPVEGDIIVEAELDYEQGYVGQQLTLRYNILTTKNVRSYNFGKLPSFDGFFAQELQGVNSPSETIVKDGVQYVKRTIKSVALFPQQKGVFEIDPAIVDLGISNGQRSNSFFFTTKLKQYRTRTNKLKVRISDLPDDAPASFSGAVGEFTLATSIDKKSIAMDDAVTLTLQVRGIGDGKFIEAPKQPFVEDFDIYDPNLINENQKLQGDKISYVKTYEYLMVPKRAGRLRFKPEFSYFDTDSAAYVTIQAKPYSINVLKSTGRELADVENQEIALAPTYFKTNLTAKGSSFAMSPAHWAINGAFIFGLLGLVFAKRRQMQLDNIDPALKRRNKALKLAQSRLSIADGHLKKDEIKEFYIELRKGLLDYLADKINLPSSQLSKAEISDLLIKSKLEEFMPSIMDIMQKGEQAIYASINSGEESDIYQRAITMIQEIEVALDAQVD